MKMDEKNQQVIITRNNTDVVEKVDNDIYLGWDCKQRKSDYFDFLSLFYFQCETRK